MQFSGTPGLLAGSELAAHPSGRKWTDCDRTSHYIGAKSGANMETKKLPFYHWITSFYPRWFTLLDLLQVKLNYRIIYNGQLGSTKDTVSNLKLFEIMRQLSM